MSLVTLQTSRLTQYSVTPHSLHGLLKCFISRGLSLSCDRPFTFSHTGFIARHGIDNSSSDSKLGHNVQPSRLIEMLHINHLDCHCHVIAPSHFLTQASLLVTLSKIRVPTRN